MRKVILVIGLFFSSTGFSETINIEQNKNEVLTTYSNKKPKSLNHYNDNQLHGNALSWYDNGQIKYIVPYNKGNPDGIGRSWYDNGARKSVTVYKNGKILEDLKWKNVKPIHLPDSIQEYFTVINDNGQKRKFLEQFGDASVFSKFGQYDPDGLFYRADFERYQLYLKPIYFLNNELLIISDNARQRGMGCCADPSVSLFFEVKNENQKELMLFAEKYRCDVIRYPFDNNHSYAKDLAITVGANVAVVCDWEFD